MLDVPSMFNGTAIPESPHLPGTPKQDTDREFRVSPITVTACSE